MSFHLHKAIKFKDSTLHHNKNKRDKEKTSTLLRSMGEITFHIVVFLLYVEGTRPRFLHMCLELTPKVKYVGKG